MVAEEFKCKDGGRCGLGGYCRDCPPSRTLQALWWQWVANH